MRYVDVILPLPVQGLFTYLLPEAANMAEVGMRVVVPFGSKKLYTALIARIHSDSPEGDFDIKEVLELLDEKPVVNSCQLAFFSWIASYYMCSLGDVFKAAIPSGMKLESESSVVLAGEYDEALLSEREALIVDTLTKNKNTKLREISKALNIPNVLPLIRSLIGKGIVEVKEELRRSYKPRVEAHVKLSEAFFDENILGAWLYGQKKSPKRAALLSAYLALAMAERAFRKNDIRELAEVDRKTLLTKSGCSVAVLNALLEQGLLISYPYEVGRLTHDVDMAGRNTGKSLNHSQQKAYDSILKSWEDKSVCLLHGVTSSGKTEVYIKLIEKTLSEGKQVLFLLPEIALTTQITTRLSQVFGQEMGVYHSKFPDAERVEIWSKQCSDNPYKLILGVRSSLFLPFHNLGMVIVDEEHETSYKQQDPAPRYNARDAAMVLADNFKAKVLLGTATPSLESYTNAEDGKYALVEMKERFGGVKQPKILVVDVKELRRKKLMKSPFSPLLIDEIKNTLERKEQIILFQNRRGYSPVLECHSCGWIPKCSKCDVSLTYHREQHKLVCHYCGQNYNIPSACPSCEGTELRSIGYGTEKIEEKVSELFPEARVARMDLDTTRSRLSYESIILNFQQGNTDILIGTQMVTKGLDFDRVRVVGILDADTMLNLPDFRSFERAFSMMVQVSGRAGRRGDRGLVVLQTRQASLPLIDHVVSGAFSEMYREQMDERELFHYPPFYRIISIYIKHRDAAIVEDAAQVMAKRLRFLFEDRVLGPDRPAVGRVQMLYIRKILLKAEKGAPMARVKNALLNVQKEMLSVPKFRSIGVFFDVDPL